MNEETVLSFLLGLHVLAGSVSLVVAPLAMLVAKGGNWHRIWGKTFFYGMGLVALTAILLGFIRPNVLMALVALFSFHMIASGYRALYLKKLHEGQKPRRIDHVIQGSAGVVNLGIFLWGLSHLFLGNSDGTALIFLVFGSIGLLMVLMNMRRFFKRNHDKQEWLYGHMTGFLGGYIATVSAFSAVNMGFIEPKWLQWLWPTIIGSPLIFYWVRYYRGRFTRGRRPKDIMKVRI
ncbi:MAG: hypothetical protein R2815_02385 [Flavobacteriales bacterium]